MRLRLHMEGQFKRGRRVVDTMVVAPSSYDQLSFMFEGEMAGAIEELHSRMNKRDSHDPRGEEFSMGDVLGHAVASYLLMERYRQQGARIMLVERDGTMSEMTRS